MNKAAKLAGKLMRTASYHPSLVPKLMPKIARLLKRGSPIRVTLHESSTNKQGGPDTAAFAAWAIVRGKRYSVSECRAVLDRLKVPMIELADRVAPKRGPLTVGETVSPDAHSNTNEANVDACRKYHKKHGEIEKVDQDGVAVRFDDGRLVRFEGENRPGKSLGIGRSTRPSVVDERSHGKAAIEVIYLSDKNAKPPSHSQIMAVQEYVDKGLLKGEKRNRSYYSGLALKQAMGKKGYYFTVFAQGRDTFPRSLNPKKGTVLYIGRLGGRPGGWKAEYAKLMADVETPETRLAHLRLAGKPIEEQEFRHPDTGNRVQFKSLPLEMQKKLRSQSKGKGQKGPKEGGVAALKKKVNTLKGKLDAKVTRYLNNADRIVSQITDVTLQGKAKDLIVEIKDDISYGHAIESKLDKLWELARHEIDDDEKDRWDVTHKILGGLRKRLSGAKNDLFNAKEKEKTKSTPKKEKSLSEQKTDFLKNFKGDAKEKARIQKMTPAEFSAMAAAIADDDEDEGGGGKKKALDLIRAFSAGARYARSR